MAKSELCYLIEEIPDLTLNKYASLDGSGVDGVLKRHLAFLRQWNRKGLLSDTSIHLFYYYDGADRASGDVGGEKGSRLQILFMVRGEAHQLNNVPQLVSASSLSEFYRFKPCTFERFLKLCRAEKLHFSSVSTLLKKEVFVRSSLDQIQEDGAYYMVSQWEMNEEGRLYTMMNMMEALNEKTLYRIDLYPTEKGSALRSELRKPVAMLRERQYQRAGASGARDYEADSVLRSYEDMLKKVEESPHFIGNLFVFGTDRENTAVLLDAAGAEALKTGSYELASFSGSFDMRSMLGESDDCEEYSDVRRKILLQRSGKAWTVCREEAQRFRLRYLPTLFTVEEVVPFFCLPALYEGEVIQKRKETTPPPVSAEGGLYLGKDDNGYDVFFPLKNLAKHAFIAGVPGSGKTNTMHHLTSTLWKKHRIPFLVLEPAKQEYRALLNQPGMEQVYLFSPNADMTFPLHINPFEFPKGLMLAEHIRRLGSVFEGAFPLDNPMPFLLDTAIEAVYRDLGWTPETVYTEKTKLKFPTMSMLYKRLEEELLVTKYSDEVRGNLESALKVRIGSLLRREMGDVFDVPKSTIAPERWLEIPAVIELEAMGTGPANFLTLMLCALIREALKVHPHYEKNHARHVIFIEEAHNLIGPESEEVSGTEANPKQAATAFIVKMLAEVRALKESIVIADQLPTVMAQEVIKNTGLKVGLRITSSDDRVLLCSTMSANGLQMEEMATFQPGRALISYEGLKRPFTMQTREWMGRWDLPGCDEDAVNPDWCKQHCERYADGECVPDRALREKTAASLPDRELADRIRNNGPYREITEKSFEIEAYRFKEQFDRLEAQYRSTKDVLGQARELQRKIKHMEDEVVEGVAVVSALPEEESTFLLEQELQQLADNIKKEKDRLQSQYLNSPAMHSYRSLIVEYIALIAAIQKRRKHWARLGIRAFSSVDAAGGMPDSPRTTALADGVRSIQKMALSNARVLFYGGNEFLREPELVRDQLKRAAEILSR